MLAFSPEGDALRVAISAAIAMLAFAANSVLARLALGGSEMSAPGYTGVRMVAGALMLGAILYLRARRQGEAHFEINGSWRAAAALLGYALAFSIAYLMVGAGTGALVLFASVQIGMLAWAIIKGDRPGPLEWLGFAIASAALVYLVSPGLVAPPLLGTVLMVAAGLSWAAYSILGQGSRSPLADTAGNFIRCLPFGIVLIASADMGQMSGPGVFYAIASGAIASGLGYAVWYSVLPSLKRTSAAFIQLTVPAIAAAGGVLLIGEPLSARLLIASAGILSGVALALLAAQWRRGRRQDGAVPPQRP